jgi:hypothetical protein
VRAEISDDEGSGSEHSEGLGVPIGQEKVESVKPEKKPKKNGKGKGKAKAVVEEEEKLEVESHGDEEDEDEDMDEDECVLNNSVAIDEADKLWQIYCGEYPKSSRR